MRRAPAAANWGQACTLCGNPDKVQRRINDNCGDVVAVSSVDVLGDCEDCASHGQRTGCRNAACAPRSSKSARALLVAGMWFSWLVASGLVIWLVLCEVSVLSCSRI